MSKNIRTQIGKVIGKTLNSYHARVKPVIDDIKFKEQYQGRIIDCMVGEVDDNYIETPETDAPIVKLEHSKEGVVKIPSIKGKTILVDADGNETDTPAEGCKLVSVGEDEDNKLIILSKNKNLFNGKVMGKGYFNPQNGVLVPSNTNLYYDFIPIKGDTYVNISSQLSVTGGIIVQYDENKNFISATDRVFPRKEKINANAKYIRISVNYSNANCNQEMSDNAKIQLEYDNQTSYVEPKQHKTEILLDEPLRGLPNGVCDEIVGNKLIRRVGLKLLDGDGNWLNASGYPALHYLNTPNIGNAKLYVDANTVPNMLCDKLEVVSYSNAQRMGDNGMCITNRGNSASHSVAINLPYSESNAGKVKNWVKENPVIIYYELAEPIIEKLPNGITLQGFNDTTMYIENSITPTISYRYNALIPYKEELKTQKEEVETNTLDIENNIIPYLMDMEYNLMLMEDN